MQTVICQYSDVSTKTVFRHNKRFYFKFNDKYNLLFNNGSWVIVENLKVVPNHLCVACFIQDGKFIKVY